jgi:ribonuclease E
MARAEFDSTTSAGVAQPSDSHPLSAFDYDKPGSRQLKPDGAPLLACRCRGQSRARHTRRRAMANRQQRQDQQQPRGRNPMQTSPDDDEAQVADQSHLAADDETERDDESEALPVDGKRRALQASQEREGERLAQAGEEDEDEDEDDDLDDLDDDDDEDDTIGPTS